MSKGKVLSEKYKIGDQIAQGGFSTVYYCSDLQTQERYAVKVLRKSVIQKLNMEEAFEREASALRALKYSPYVTNVVEILQSTRNYYVIMDLADCGTLLQVIVRGNLSQMAARKYFRQLLQGLKDIHDSNVVHRDIKPENTLLDSWRDLKISDFGFAACAGPDRVLTRQCGTPQYVAPEVLHGKGYLGRPADIWSAGVTLYVMLYRTLPFAAASTEKLFDKIKIGKYETPPQPNVSPAAIHLLSVMLRTDPSKRWPIERLMRHPWLLGHNVLPTRIVHRMPAVCGGHSPDGSDATAPAFGSTPGGFGSSVERANDSFQFLAVAGGGAVSHGGSRSTHTTTAAEGDAATNDFFATMMLSAVAPSMSCPDFRSLFNIDDSGAPKPFSGQSERRRRSIRHGAAGLSSSSGAAGPLELEHGATVASFRRSPYDASGLARESPAGGGAGRRSPGASSRASPQSGMASSVAPLQHIDTPGAEPSRFERRSFVRRFGVIHVRIALNFICVCVVVLVVGCLRVLFDIDVGKLPLPAALKETIEQLLKPPTAQASDKRRAAGVAKGVETPGSVALGSPPAGRTTPHNNSGAGEPSSAGLKTPRRKGGMNKAVSQVFELGELPDVDDDEHQQPPGVFEMEKALSDGEAAAAAGGGLRYRGGGGSGAGMHRVPSTSKFK